MLQGDKLTGSFDINDQRCNYCSLHLHQGDDWEGSLACQIYWKLPCCSCTCRFKFVRTFRRKIFSLIRCWLSLLPLSSPSFFLGVWRITFNTKVWLCLFTRLFAVHPIDHRWRTVVDVHGGTHVTVESEVNYIFRYSVGGSSMIAGLFFFRPIVKILIYRFKICLVVTGLIPLDPGNFRECSQNHQEISQRFSITPGVPPYPLPTPIHVPLPTPSL